MAQRARKPDRPDMELSYRVGLWGRERYVLKAQTFEVYYKSFFNSSAYSMDLVALDPCFSRYSTRPKKWFASAMGFGTIALAFLASALWPASPYRSWLWLGVGGATIGLGVSVFQFLSLSKDCLAIQRSYDGTPAVDLRWERPDAVTFRRFVNELQARIEALQAEEDEGTLASELRGLDRLRREGRLSDQEFKAAKAMLLGLEPWQLE